MANKKDNSDNAILLAILNDIQSVTTKNPINSVISNTAILQSDIKRDKADSKDVHRLIANQILPPVEKIKNQFREYPSLITKLNTVLPDKNFDPENINLSNLPGLANMITYYLQNNKVNVFAEGGQFETNQNTIDVKIEDKTYRLLVAETEEEKEKGLMNVIEMDPDEGMLFDYSDEPQPSISFWMKNTEIPLDIIFINQDGVVISVKQGEPLSEEPITESSEFISCVIELNVNSGIKAGYRTDLFKDIDDEFEDETEDEHPELNVNRLYVYGSDGTVQAELQGGERIFSRKSSKVIIRKAKKAYASKEEKDYKALGRYIFKEMDAQDNRDPEYVEN